jgi:hypothetical protein
LAKGIWKLCRAAPDLFVDDHWRRLLADLRGVENVFERVGVLVFFHQLEIDQALGARDFFGVAEPGGRGGRKEAASSYLASAGASILVALDVHRASGARWTKCI